MTVDVLYSSRDYELASSLIVEFRRLSSGFIAYRSFESANCLHVLYSSRDYELASCFMVQLRLSSGFVSYSLVDLFVDRKSL